MKTILDDYILIKKYNSRKSFYCLIGVLLHNLMNLIRNLFLVKYHQYKYFF